MLATSSPLPTLEICRRGAVERATASGLEGDLEVESEAFNRRFCVSADDPRAVAGLLSADTQARLLELDPQHLRAEGTHVCASEEQTHRGDDELPHHAHLATVVAVLPAAMPEGLAGEHPDDGPADAGPSATDPPTG